jgi:hypothetical protein
VSESSPREHPSGSPLPELAAAITAGAVRLAAATAAWLHLIAEFDRREGWHGYGITSCAHWLAWQCGLSPGAAREHVRVARSLESLPLIRTAFAEGRLSYSKVRALTRIAEPDSEESLLDLALELTASQVERTVRQWRRADLLDVDEPPNEERQEFEYWWDDAGMLIVKIRMVTEQGAAFIAAVDSQAERTARRERAQEKKARAARGEPEPDDHGSDGDDVRLARERTTARRLAALTALAEASAEADRRAGDPPRREVVVHVDADVLADDAAAGRAYLEGGPALSAAMARRMLCEASVVVMLEKDREPLAVGRRKRRATRAQRRALLRRDGGCARPGCLETRIERLHAHHMQHWLFGGRTDLVNLVLLCDKDHGLVHDLDLVMTRRDGVLVVTTPDGHRVWGSPDAAFAGGLASLGTDHRAEDVFVGVHPVDTKVGRRPMTAGPVARAASTPAGPSHRPAGRSDRLTRPGVRRRRRAVGAGLIRRGLGPEAAPIGAALFPHGEPDLPVAMPVNGERMDVRYVVGVLMGNRDLVRRLAAETGAGVPAGTPVGPRPRHRLDQILAPSGGGPSGSCAATPDPELGGDSMPTV